MKKELNEELIAMMKDALLNVDRYFKAKDNLYDCDESLCETTARFAVEDVLNKIEELKGSKL